MERSGLIGQTLNGRYKVEELLGQGGMSAVYKAFDPNLKRMVAVKVIHSHLAGDARFRSRFESEATAVAALRHSNIVQVYDFSNDDDLYYMVQEFVPGETLQDHLRRLNEGGRSMPVADALRYTGDIAEAAGYAHRRGMIHRDIKPANIMLSVHDEAILMDFGIVKITGSSEHTVTGELRYRFPNRLLLSLNAIYVDGLHDLDGDDVYTKISSYVVAHLKASLPLTEVLECYASVGNLADEDYEQKLGYAREGRTLRAHSRAPARGTRRRDCPRRHSTPARR